MEPQIDGIWIQWWWWWWDDDKPLITCNHRRMLFKIISINELYFELLWYLIFIEFLLFKSCMQKKFWSFILFIWASKRIVITIIFKEFSPNYGRVFLLDLGCAILDLLLDFVWDSTFGFEFNPSSFGLRFDFWIWIDSLHMSYLVLELSGMWIGTVTALRSCIMFIQENC